MYGKGIEKFTVGKLIETLGEQKYQEVHTSLLYENPEDYSEITREEIEEKGKRELVRWLLQVPGLKTETLQNYIPFIISFLTEEYNIDFSEYDSNEQLGIIKGIANPLREECRNRLFEKRRFDLLSSNKYDRVF